MEVKTYTIDEIKNIVTPIAEKYQIAQVYLFGSFARGDFDEQSDIDIRIEKGNLNVCLMRFLYGSVGCIRTKSRCTDYRKSVR